MAIQDLVPDSIPGQQVTDPAALHGLRQYIANLCQVQHTRFPGSQPVSFTQDSLDLLEQRDFWVCEKSNGVRVMVLIMSNPETSQEIYLIDRNDKYYMNTEVYFPRHDSFENLQTDTLLDAELVIDVDPESGQHVLRLLLFDCLVVNGENIMHKPLLSRYGRLREFVVAPHLHFHKVSGPQMLARQPFEIKLKPQELAYGIEAVFKNHLPKLQHGNDGLIFTCAESAYTPGTDPYILKWKPPEENSIDFKLQLRFPAKLDSPDHADYTQKPIFALYESGGYEGDRFFDILAVSDEEWSRMKSTGEQYDGRVVECVWNSAEQNWKILRFRDDKRQGNFKDIVQKIIQSIQDGVEAPALIERAYAIRKAFKARAQERASGARPLQVIPPAPQPIHVAAEDAAVPYLPLPSMSPFVTRPTALRLNVE
ncbi:uncharacterized protein L969DRAFT_24551 [Mixia osmundae IAM 14324]|uniref:mRNA-capping enzyme subunit alpha n=1 Tax=Mixia osmundae (strain CBS 9802 / IAM 14324 / JCM 22182 / KY 12970) TaxID=764103 RepID=G7E721_MIXOS|nr:uncharacterized protein L969DRAFT_24551 [Mixia osmundae IAM 14324]KEI38987.1 hypothetical protein L969DRAFT_24551 [Mixia osmundae IAM 14324]GAA98631.1 hypothetical protein E5Q_05318 [Mixia osmundae IAM 14324]